MISVIYRIRALPTGDEETATDSYTPLHCPSTRIDRIIY